MATAMTAVLVKSRGDCRKPLPISLSLSVMMFRRNRNTPIIDAPLQTMRERRSAAIIPMF
jgi:hypothetical protein